MDGMRAAMYGEMAASVAGNRPWREQGRRWDVALEGAIQFLTASGLDQRTCRHLLDEAAVVRNAGVIYGWDVSVARRCERLAIEFRRRVHQG